MKVQIVRNSKGDVVATIEQKTGVQAVGIVPPKGEEYKVEEVEAHPNYASDLATFYKKHQKKGTQ